MNTWPAPYTSRPVHATVTVPGSKSQTNRALVLAALAAATGGVSTISGALRSRDTDLMIGALEALGLRVDGPADELDGQRNDRPAARCPHRLRPGRHGVAFRPAAGGTRPGCASRSTATSRPGSARSRRC